MKVTTASRCELNMRLDEILVVHIRIFYLRSFGSIHEILVAKEYQIPILHIDIVA